MTFIKSNIANILWCIIYVLLTWVLVSALVGTATFQTLAIVIVLYALSITIALSPIGEFLLRITADVRPLKTQEEIEYIQPLFDEVYENAKELYPKMNTNIKVHIVDAMVVNAFAVGRKTVALYRGSVTTFTENELKGIIAHELGHLRYFHTEALLLSFVGNAIFSTLVLILQVLTNIIEFVCNLATNTNFVLNATLNIILILTKLIMKAMYIVFIYLSHIILSLNSRSNEYQADDFAFQCGYGEELKNSLYILQKMSMSRKMSIKEKLFSSHPHIASRIKRLENKLAEENNTAAANM